MPLIRNTVQPDLLEVQKIYAQYVLNTFATFEITPPDQDELTRRWQNIINDGLPLSDR